MHYGVFDYPEPILTRHMQPTIHRERTSGTKGTTRPKPREGWVEKVCVYYESIQLCIVAPTATRLPNPLVNAQPSTNTRSELLKKRQEVAHAEIKINQNYRSSTGPPAASPGNHHPSTRRGRTREDMLRQRRSEHAGGPGGSASNQVHVKLQYYPSKISANVTSNHTQGDSGEDVAQRWSTKRWTDVVIDFREPRGNPEDLLDENGKERVRPLF